MWQYVIDLIPKYQTTHSPNSLFKGLGLVPYLVPLQSGNREVDFRLQMEGTIAVGFCRWREKTGFCCNDLPLRICCSFLHCLGVFPIDPTVGQSRLRGLSTQIYFPVLRGSLQCKMPQKDLSVCVYLAMVIQQLPFRYS